MRQGARESEGSETYVILGFRVPTTYDEKCLMTSYSGEVSPPPASTTTRSKGEQEGARGSERSEGSKREQGE